MFDLMAPDLMHEFELGVWKDVFAQLVRLPSAIGGGATTEMDKRWVSAVAVTSHRLFLPRYRLVPAFGRDTIRRFRRDASGLKRMTAHDYEDLLQV